MKILIIILTCLLLNGCAATVVQFERTQNPPSIATQIKFYQADKLAALKAYYGD